MIQLELCCVDVYYHCCEVLVGGWSVGVVFAIATMMIATDVVSGDGLRSENTPWLIQS